MNLEVKMHNGNILVKELIDDIKVNGVMTSYDVDNPYMFCDVIKISNEAAENLSCDINDILVIKRHAKEEFVSGLYFIHWKDVRCALSKEEYSKMILEGVSF